MASDPLTIDSLPNEMLISVLSRLPTPELLPLSAVCRRFHALVMRLLHHRLLRAASSAEAGRQMILEAYHPSAKLTTPYLHCNYLGTGALGGGPLIDTAAEAEGDPGFFEPGCLGDLKELYSRFRPVVQVEDRRGARFRSLRRWRLLQLQGGDDAGGIEQSSAEAEVDADEPATLEVHLDDCESFSQLCTVTNMVKSGPRRGVFVSHVNVSDGVIRLWRDWLSQHAEPEPAGGDEAREERDGSGEPAILWADAQKHVGLRFRVVRTATSAPAPLLVSSDEDLPVSYRLEYEELLVRTSQLLLMAEKSDVQEESTSDSTSSPVFIDRTGPVSAMFVPVRLPHAQRHGDEAKSYDRLQWMEVAHGVTVAA